MTTEISTAYFYRGHAKWRMKFNSRASKMTAEISKVIFQSWAKKMTAEFYNVVLHSRSSKMTAAFSNVALHSRRLHFPTLIFYSK